MQAFLPHLVWRLCGSLLCAYNMDYYALKTDKQGRQLYSYSALSALLKGGSSGINPEAALFGQTFHAMLLMTERPEGWQKVKNSSMLYPMVDRVHCEYDYLDLYGKGVRREWEYFRTINSIPFKSKIDLVSADRSRITDFKTTSCWEYEDVLLSIGDYNYDLQGYLYLQMERKADVFELCFVQKAYRPNLWRYVIARDSPDYEAGKEKFFRALKQLQK